MPGRTGRLLGRFGDRSRLLAKALLVLGSPPSPATMKVKEAAPAKRGHEQSNVAAMKQGASQPSPIAAATAIPPA